MQRGIKIDIHAQEYFLNVSDIAKKKSGDRYKEMFKTILG